MKKLISSVCFFGLVFNAWGNPEMNEQEAQFEEINSPEEQRHVFSLSDLFSSSSFKSKKDDKKSTPTKKDYFEEDSQAFAEDDPWKIDDI